MKEFYYKYRQIWPRCFLMKDYFLFWSVLIGASLAVCLGFFVKVGDMTGRSPREWNIKSYTSTYGNGQIFYYLEYLPPGYNNTGNEEKYPTIISLHGLGHGTNGLAFDGERLKRANLEKTIKKGREYPFIILSVHQPTEVKGRYNYTGTYADGSLIKNDSLSWDPEVVDEVLERAKKELRIDERRIYLLGCSMGAAGVWNYLKAHGDKIAAAVSIAGYYTKQGPYYNNPHANIDSLAQLPVTGMCNEKVLNTPVWAFHAADDEFVHPLFTYKIIQKINECNQEYGLPAKAKLTIFKRDGHLQIYRKVVGYDEKRNYEMADDVGYTGGVPLTKYYPDEEFENDIFGWMLSNQLSDTAQFIVASP